MMPGARGFTLLGGIACMTGVIFAAMGSHLDGGIDNFASYRAWQSAGMMHLVHGLGLLFIANALRQGKSPLLRWAGLLMALGIVLFCGSIYTRILGDLPDTANLAPIGGTCLILAWLLVAVSAVWPGKDKGKNKDKS